MSATTFNTVDNVKKIGFNADGSVSTASFDPNEYLKNTSIFTIAGNRDKTSAFTPTNADKALISKGNKSKSDANKSKLGAAGWISKCLGLHTEMAQVNASVNNVKNTTQQQGQKVQAQLASFEVQSKSLTEENLALNAQIADLTTQQESDMVGNETGVGEKNAFSLNFGANDDTNKRTTGLFTTYKPNKDESGSGSKGSEISSKIDSLNAKSSSNSAKLGSLSQTSASTIKNFQTTLKKSNNVINAHKQTATKAAEQAKTANAVGIATTAVGVATTGVSVALAAGIITAPSSPPVAGAGIASTTAGTGATTAATKLATALPKIEKALAAAQSVYTTFSAITSGSKKNKA